MKRGTTPTHTFTIPISAENVSAVRVIYSQGGNVILKKETKDCEVSGNTIKVTLTQEETFLFDDKFYVEIQVRVLTDNGDALVSDEIFVDVGKCLDDEVLL